MKEVIRIPELQGSSRVTKPVEITHELTNEGWEEEDTLYSSSSKVVYIGKCVEDGDLFAEYHNGYIYFYKGHLNSGKY